MREFKTVLVFDDYEEFESLSKNIDKNRIEIYASKFQNQILRDLIGNELYEDFCKDSMFSCSVTSITSATDAVITLSEYPQGFGVGHYFYLSINSIDFGFFQVKTFNGVSFTCSFNSVNIIFSSGSARLFFTEYNFELRNISKPYLIYGALSRFAPIANVSSTAYGFQTKRNDYGEDSSNNAALVAEYKRNIDYYAKVIISYLSENKTNYVLYIEPNNEDNFNYRENIPIRPKSRRLFDVRRK